MASRLNQIHSLYAQSRKRMEAENPQLFAKVRDAKHRLTRAIKLETIHAARLEALRSYANFAIRECNAHELRMFLGHYGEAIDSEIAAAERAAAGRANSERIAA